VGISGDQPEKSYPLFVTAGAEIAEPNAKVILVPPTPPFALKVIV
jgi:hypothetical protein